ncbi:hypothetical protein KQH54_01315 [bacterium]|nr:hypothetical protein [bacterium]
MDFDSARKQFERLTRLFNNGELTSEEYTQGVDQISITDSEGNDWMIGMQSGKWYRRKGMEDWVEDDPHAVQAMVEPPLPKNNRRGRRLLTVLLLLALVLACTGFWYFGEGGKIFNSRGSAAQTEESDVMTQVAMLNMEASQTIAAAEGTSDMENQVTQTPERTQTLTISASDLTATATTPTATPQPTATETPLPPEPAASPEAWQPQSVLDMEQELTLKQDWEEVPDKNWEYEFLNYEDRKALLIQFKEPEVLFHAEGDQFDNVERQMTLAIPDVEGGVSFFCRWDENTQSGYKFRLTNQVWSVLRVDAGAESVLINGNQSTGFQAGNYASFVMRCQDAQLEISQDGAQLASYADNTYETGMAGLRFEINEGIGLAFFLEDRVMAQLAEDVVAGEGDVVRLPGLDIQFVQLNDEYDEMEESAYQGEDVIGLELRIDNQSGTAVSVQTATFLLTDGLIWQESLDFLPESVGARTTLPNTLAPGITTGEVFFSGISPDDLADWLFVVDLRYEGFGEADFIFVTE